MFQRSWNKILFISTDASPYALGPVLEQMDYDGIFKTVRNYSLKLYYTENNYTAHERRSGGIKNYKTLQALHGNNLLVYTEKKAIEALYKPKNISDWI
ncbi:hypothetical protein AYI70_g9455 [Smittium culicis]|uniref:Reverse transcriptase RNase H-like domain-containing protein n=1 Tax=Smittium culicis TaxID=133412 RepID=A0A1R1XB67_9FUNG|nr:hypothetical protein AYI70_g9455 [Smittium culicis]